MSNKIRPSQYRDPKGVIAEGFDGGAILCQGTTVPTDATTGYSRGCIFMDSDAAAGSQFWVNEGTITSCLFKALPSLAAGQLLALAVAGVAAGYKLARGIRTQVAASDTVVTGLATVVAATVSFASVGPTVKQMWVSATIGDQAGTPAAGSILIKTWKPTNNTNDSTPTAATDFTDSATVAWIAVGT